MINLAKITIIQSTPKISMFHVFSILNEIQYVDIFLVKRLKIIFILVFC